MREELKRIILEKVDRTLGVLGEDAKHIIYSRLERVYGVKYEDIPLRLNDLHKALDDLIGSRGAYVVEEHIAEKLYKELNIDFTRKENWTLAEYVEHAFREVDH